MTHVPPSHHTVAGRVVVASVLAALPILLQGMFPGPVSASLVSDHADDVRGRIEETQRRRAFYQAIEKCKERRDGGETVACPDVNDADAIEEFLLHESAPPAVQGIPRLPSMLLRYDDLKIFDRALIRSYARIGNCPISLLDYLPGFYDLCLAILEDEAYQGLQPVVDLKAREAIRGVTP